MVLLQNHCRGLVKDSQHVVDGVGRCKGWWLCIDRHQSVAHVPLSNWMGDMTFVPAEKKQVETGHVHAAPAVAH